MALSSTNFVLCLWLIIGIAASHDHESMGHGSHSHSSITEPTDSENLTDVHEGHEHHSHHGHDQHGMMDHSQHSETTTSKQEVTTVESEEFYVDHNRHVGLPTTSSHHHHQPSSSNHDHHGPVKSEKEVDMMMDQAASVADNRLSKKDEEKYNDYIEMVPDTHDGHDGHSHHQDHDGHDMKDNDSALHSMHGMMMHFYAGLDVTVLFEQWHIKDVAGMIGSVIGIILLATFYEGLKYFREYLFKQYVSSMQFSTVAVTGESGRITQVHKVQRHRILSFAHLIQTCLHVLQMIISYFLMLIFMTYNVWLCLAVITGAGIGYFVFGWKKATVVDITEHCH